MIYFNGNIKKIIYQNHNISSVYACGGSLVWSDTPTPPTGDKCQMIFNTWSGDTTYSIPCNSSSVLSQSETDISEYSRVALKEVIIGSCVTEVGYNAFNRSSNLTSVTLSNTVTTIGNVAFENCTILPSITFPNSLITIGSQSFMYDFGLTSLNIPDSVTTIGNQAFYQCYGLTAVTIGSGITSIGNGAFENCSALTSVTINATTPPTLDLGDEFDNTNNCPIYVPCESVNAYKTAQYWSLYASRIQGIPPCSEPTYRWVDLDPTVDYYCSGIAKRYKQQKQESYDGVHWTNVEPAEYQRGSYIDDELISSDCGYGGTGRISFLSTASTNTATTTCITGFTLVNSRKNLYNYDISGDTVCGMRGTNGSTVVRSVCSVAFPCNTRTISNNAFYRNTSEDTSKPKIILFNEGLQTIGDYAFKDMVSGDVDDTMFGVMVIPSTVTSIGQEAFNFDGSSFSSGSKNGWLHIYFMGTTPPTMADNIFGVGGVQMNTQIVLYVPEGTVQAYKDALGANYKIQSSPMAVGEINKQTYDSDMFTLHNELYSQGFLSN